MKTIEENVGKGGLGRNRGGIHVTEIRFFHRDESSEPVPSSVLRDRTYRCGRGLWCRLTSACKGSKIGWFYQYKKRKLRENQEK